MDSVIVAVECLKIASSPSLLHCTLVTGVSVVAVLAKDEVFGVWTLSELDMRVVIMGCRAHPTISHCSHLLSKCRVATNISHCLKVQSRWFKNYIFVKKCILINFWILLWRSLLTAGCQQRIRY